MLTFLEIQDQVLDICELSASEERGRLKRLINEVAADFTQRTLTPIKTVGPVTLTNLVGDYVLTAAPFSLTDFIAIRTVIYNQSGSGPNNVLDQVTPAEVYDMRNQLWSGFLYAFAIEGPNKLMLIPSPGTADTLTLVYEYRPAPMATDSDTPALLLDEDVDAIVMGAARRMMRLKNPQLAAQFAVEYQQLIGIAQARQNRKGGAAGMRLRVGTLRRPPHDRSTYPGGEA